MMMRSPQRIPLKDRVINLFKAELTRAGNVWNTETASPLEINQHRSQAAHSFNASSNLHGLQLGRQEANRSAVYCLNGPEPCLVTGMEVDQFDLNLEIYLRVQKTASISTAI